MILTAAAALVPLTVACGAGKADSGAVSSQRPGPQQPSSQQPSSRQPSSRQSQQPGSRQAVTGVDWRVDSLTVGGRTRSAPATARLRIDADGRAAGNLGCNRFSARATVRGDRITLGGLRTTRMACTPDRMEFERALAGALTTGTLVARADAGSLTLTDGNGDLIRLSRHALG
ncbi:META domain-containing protein [Streptomyces monashensis]|nr:META domain-containing protein [Streptomyces monashensis]